MLKTAFWAVFVALCLVAPGFALAGPAAPMAFFQNLRDIPLMPGLYELTDEGMVFDKPEGRIVEAGAVSETLSQDKIKSFYNSTLPEMGWQNTGPGLYKRGGEILKMTVKAQGATSVLHLSVSPADSVASGH